MRRVVIVVLVTLSACAGLPACTRDQLVGVSSPMGPVGSGSAFAPSPPPRFNIPTGPGGMRPSRSCVVTSALDGDPGPCRPQDPERAFQPVLKWSWTPPARVGGFQKLGSQVTPLVANLTDDDGNGRIDLCDVPDVVVVTYRIAESPELHGGIVLLAGDTGRLELEFDPGPGRHIAASVTPALGDLDGDGLPEVVTIDPDDGKLLIFDHRGRLTRVGAEPVSGPLGFGACSAIALYDLDADGLPEIIYGATDVFDSQGRRRFRNDLNSWFTNAILIPGSTCMTAAAADLDGDGRQEVVLGNAVFRADGSLYWRVFDGLPGHPQIANFDSDPQPEVLLVRAAGTLLLEHDGAVKFRSAPQTRRLAPPGSPDAYDECVARPVAIHELDGTGAVDAAGGACGEFNLYTVSPAGLLPYRSFQVRDNEAASSTAFDFLGRGHAQAVYSDWDSIYAFDGKSGAVELKLPNWSPGALLRYPVVADVDNDGSADVIVVSSRLEGELARDNSVQTWPPPVAPTVQVFQDKDRRWVSARRIWNQHAYHVTNVREDGTIPRVPPASWLGLNTFRSNAPVAGSCQPIAD